MEVILNYLTTTKLNYLIFLFQTKTNYNLKINGFYLNCKDVVVYEQLLKLISRTTFEIVVNPVL